MKMEEVLGPGAVLLDLTVPDKKTAIARVSAELARAAGIPREPIEAALVAREALGSTGVGGGVALPHARMHSLRHTHALVLRLSSPIDFASIDSAPVDLVCAVVAPDEPGSALLEAVSTLSKVLRDTHKVAAIRSAESARAARAILLGLA